MDGAPPGSFSSNTEGSLKRSYDAEVSDDRLHKKPRLDSSTNDPLLEEQSAQKALELELQSIDQELAMLNQQLDTNPGSDFSKKAKKSRSSTKKSRPSAPNQWNLDLSEPLAPAPIKSSKAKKLRAGEPGLEAGPWTRGSRPPPDVDAYNTDMESWKKCKEVLRKLKKQPTILPFMKEVDPVELKIYNYHSIVQHPMHIDRINSILNKNMYKVVEEFAEDVRLVFKNAMLFNPQSHVIHKNAEALLEMFNRDFQVVEEMVKDLPARRRFHALDESIAKQESVLEANRTDLARRQAIHAGNFTDRSPPLPPKPEDPPNLSYDQKFKIYSHLSALSEDYHQGVVRLFREESPLQLPSGSESVTLDISGLTNSTLHRLKAYLKKCNRVRRGELSPVSKRPSPPTSQTFQPTTSLTIEEEKVDVTNPSLGLNHPASSTSTQPVGDKMDIDETSTVSNNAESAKPESASIKTEPLPSSTSPAPNSESSHTPNLSSTVLGTGSNLLPPAQKTRVNAGENGDASAHAENKTTKGSLSQSEPGTPAKSTTNSPNADESKTLATTPATPKIIDAAKDDKTKIAENIKNIGSSWGSLNDSGGKVQEEGGKTLNSSAQLWHGFKSRSETNKQREKEMEEHTAALLKQQMEEQAERQRLLAAETEARRIEEEQKLKEAKEKETEEIRKQREADRARRLAEAQQTGVHLMGQSEIINDFEKELNGHL